MPDLWIIDIVVSYVPSRTLFMFKQGYEQLFILYEQKVCMKAIDILDTLLKLATKVITNKINSITALRKTQGFKSGRQAIVAPQVGGKSIQACSRLPKSFDHIRLEDVIHLLYMS